MADDVKIERRRYPRRYAVVADYRLNDGTGRIKAAQVKNISAVGICIIIYDNILIGAELELRIYLFNTPSPIIADGKVVWTKGYKHASGSKKRFNVGVEFSGISNRIQQQISHYVSSVDKSEQESS